MTNKKSVTTFSEIELPVSERDESHSVEGSQKIGGEVDGLEVPQWRELEGLQCRDLKETGSCTQFTRSMRYKRHFYKRQIWQLVENLEKIRDMSSRIFWDQRQAKFGFCTSPFYFSY